MKNNKQNWYTKLHQSPQNLAATKVRQNSKDKLNLSIFFRIWLAVVVIIIIASIMVFDQLFERVEPTSKQVIEDTLVDTSKLLAASLSQPLQTGELATPSYQNQLDQAFNAAASNQTKTPKIYRYNDKETLNQLSTWFNQKTHSSFRVYVTNANGKVIYDSLAQSDGNAEGQDYSRWNDVYLTLQGKYGARSTRSDKNNADTSVMYVAQPITNKQGKLIGVVSVGKPVATILPYLNVARQRMLTTSLTIMLLAIFFAGLVAWWLQQSIAMVTRYTSSLDTHDAKPSFYLGKELNELTNTIENMKHKLENKAYVTDYVHTLTHELKSPLTAIKASGELLEDATLEEEDRHLLSQTISEQSTKLQSLIDRLLLLAKIEQPSFRLSTQPVNILSLTRTLITNQQPRIQKRGLTINYFVNGEEYNKQCEDSSFMASLPPILADEFWLSQALDNLINNAIFFANSHINIELNYQEVKSKVQLSIFNDGAGIPDYALDKVFDRYFSLSHQAGNTNNVSMLQTNTQTPYQPKNHTSNHKGSGLGLTLAKQVIEHHGGKINIANIHQTHTTTEGVQVSVSLPIAN